MADIKVPNYTDLDLKNNQETKIITINGIEIEVFQYLPVLEKYKLINLTLAESLENNVYNPIKLEVFFNLNLVFNYTTLFFTADDMLDIYTLFDNLEKNKVIEKVIAAIPETEYKYLLENLVTTMTRNSQYIQSVAASLDVVFDKLPKLTEGMKEIAQGLQTGDLKADNITELAEKLGFNFTDLIDGIKQTQQTVDSVQENAQEKEKIENDQVEETKNEN
jgi:methyl-accepting chemotaxis protein